MANRRMRSQQVYEMSRQVDAHLNRLNQFIKSTLQPYMEANGWSLLPPVALQMYNSPAETTRMLSRPNQLREWALQFMDERNRLVSISNQFSPQAIESVNLRERIYNMVFRLETISGAYRQLATRLQANLIYMVNPAAAPPRQKQQHFEPAPPDPFEHPGIQQDNLDDDGEDWSWTQSRRRGGR